MYVKTIISTLAITLTSMFFMSLASIQKKRKENSFLKFPDKRQRKRTSNILKDITNIDFSLGTENQESTTSTIFPDTEFGANIDETCEQEFDCSSLDTTDSENESDVDLPSSEHGLHSTEKFTAATKGQNKDGIDTPTYQIPVTPKQSSCLTSLKSQALQPQMPKSIGLSFEQRKQNNNCNVPALLNAYRH
ncbi:hypothetical protein F2Q69_00002537 [Brassica cretica]|uniref:Uncharacterized protein n=1 Tax=Brassica cretica TaxID=69181 RepID=A0A8S9PEE2_BRACR|nr:hypothetical protein F2Q69_00002537 [Brassica cretica]